MLRRASRSSAPVLRLKSMPKAVKPDEPPAAPPVYWVAAESLIYISPKTGKWVKRRQREIIDDLPALSNYPASGTARAHSGPNWVIGAGLVQPYTGAQTAGHVE